MRQHASASTVGGLAPLYEYHHDTGFRYTQFFCRQHRKDRVERVINRIRPAVQMDGGDIELVDVVDGLVKLRLVGSCSGCPSSMMTLKQGIERAIRAEVPEIVGVEAIPD